MNRGKLVVIGFLVISLIAFTAKTSAQPPQNIVNATTGEAGQKTEEVSTAELRKILASRSATVFDTRPPKEFAVSHIPGAINVAPKPGTSIALYVSDAAEIERLLKGRKSAPAVLYCNGPFCGKSKRLAQELLDAGFTNIRRYQLGIPIWRSLGGLTEIEPDGIRYVHENDKTAVFIDARDAGEFKTTAIAGTVNIPRSLLKPGKDVGEIKAAKEDGRLPMDDHNTRIVVFGKTAEQAAALAEAIANEAFHNVSYFNGSIEQFKEALQRRP